MTNWFSVPGAETYARPFKTLVDAMTLRARVVELAGRDRDKQIERAFRLALGRPPSASEAEKARSMDLSRLGVVLFNLNEFLYLE